MDIGLIGLGKMGGNMRERLRRGGHTVVGFDRNPDISDVASLEELVAALPSPKVVWVMVPAGDPTRQTVVELNELLGDGDLVVDGGNSRWTDDKEHAESACRQGDRLRRLRRLRRCLGARGRLRADVRRQALSTSPRCSRPSTPSSPRATPGFVHAGDVGAGHFAKMVHNGIEYAIMQAYAEGWELLQKVDVVDNVTEVFDSWRAGTVIRSWLLDLLVAALKEDDKLDKIAGYAEDSGEGRWTVEAAIDNAVPLRCHHRRRCSLASSRARTSRRR